MKSALLAAAVASCFAAASRAASPPPVPESLMACATVKDAMERVRCYDAQIAALSRSPAAAAVPAPDSASAAADAVPATASPTSTAAAAPPSAARTALRSVPPAAPAQPPAAQFGEELLPPASRPARTDKEIVLHSSITALHRIGRSIYEISLANGQVWRQEGSPTTAFFRVGNDVSIQKALLGSYHMSTAETGAKNWVRVTRIR